MVIVQLLVCYNEDSDQILWLIKSIYSVRCHSKTIESPWKTSFFDNFAARLMFDFWSSIEMSPFIHLTWNYVAMFLTARTKSRQIFIDFQLVTMEIHEPKVTPKLQNQQNLGKFLIFDVFVQLWIFTLTTNIWVVNSIKTTSVYQNYLNISYRFLLAISNCYRTALHTTTPNGFLCKFATLSREENESRAHPTYEGY